MMITRGRSVQYCWSVTVLVDTAHGYLAADIESAAEETGLRRLGWHHSSVVSHGAAATLRVGVPGPGGSRRSLRGCGAFPETFMASGRGGDEGFVSGDSSGVEDAGGARGFPGAL